MAGSPMKERPLSPHLQVYKPMLTMMMSIVHRITGAGLYFGMALFVWWLFAAGHSAGYFDFVQGFIGSWFGRLVLLGYTWALVHHMLWRASAISSGTPGAALILRPRRRWPGRRLAGSITLTILIWIAGYAARF
jgi:succinate dehydrogenase / fumarate reductase cytochrome b subunit